MSVWDDPLVKAAIEEVKRPVCWLRGHSWDWLFGWPTELKFCNRCGHEER